MSGFPQAASAAQPPLAYSDLLGWSFDPTGYGGGLALPSAATVYVSRIPLPSQILVTNILAYITAIGGTLTHSYLALFNSLGTILGQTADQSTGGTGWGTGGATGLHTVPLTTPVQCAPLTANDFLYAGVYSGTDVSLPSLQAADTGLAAFANAGNPANRLRAGRIAQANTATLASIVVASLSATAIYWFGLS
jgi:hypothetical protein